jgi:type IV pilus assembly protein PilO
MPSLTPKTQRDKLMLVVMLMSMVMMVVFWQFVYAPKTAEMAQARKHVESLQSSNQRAKAELAKGSVNDLRAQALRYQQNLQLMRQLVPTSNEVPALLEQVSTAARRVDLDINTVTPEPVVEGEQFDTYRYKLTVIGGYHSLAEFLANVGSLTRIVAPVNVDLEPAAGTELTSARVKRGQAVLTSKFEIQTYVAKPSAAADDDAPHSRLLKPGAKT